MNKALLIFSFLVLLLIFFFPKLDNRKQCLGYRTLMLERYNPFSRVSDELASRIEVEKMYDICFGIPYTFESRVKD